MGSVHSVEEHEGAEQEGVETPALHERLAFWAFVVYVAVAWWVLIFRLGSDIWFLRDDWMFLSGRDGGSLHDLFRPHDVHPAAVPLGVFRVMFNLFGLWFTPYLVLIVTMHLGVAAMLRLVMRRSGVGPWVASAGAGALVLFGPGEQNIHWAFQINFVSSILLGLTQLVMADHDGPFDRRDFLGVLAGIGAVMSSGIGPLMLVGVGLASLSRRGWRMAFLQTGPAALTYVTWVLVANPAEYTFARPTPTVVLDWVREGQVGTVEALGHFRIVAVLLVVLLVVGLALLVSSTPLVELRRRVAMAGALLLCGPLLFMLTSRGRWVFGLEQARSSRYLYIGAVCLLPALAVAGDAVARRWRAGTYVVIALLLVGVPGNIGAFGSSLFDARYFANQKQIILGLPRTPEAKQVPREVRPLPDAYNGEDLTIGWLLDTLDAGRLPAAGDIDPRQAAKFPIRLGLSQIYGQDVDDCKTLSKPLTLSLVRGDRLGIGTPVIVQALTDGRRASPPVGFDPVNGRTLSVELPLEVRLSASAPGETFTLCR